MTGPVETFQLSVEAAEVYEARFVPAIFGEWAPHLVEAAGVVGGQAVLDVACGTGGGGPDGRRRLVEAASEAMRPFEVGGGRIELPIQGHLITAAKAA